MKLKFLWIAAVLAMAACTTAPKWAEGKLAMKEHADTALAKAEAADWTLTKLVRDSYGYAVFPSVGKGAWVSAAHTGKASFTSTRCSLATAT